MFYRVIKRRIFRVKDWSGVGQFNSIWSLAAENRPVWCIVFNWTLYLITMPLNSSYLIALHYIIYFQGGTFRPNRPVFNLMILYWLDTLQLTQEKEKKPTGSFKKDFLECGSSSGFKHARERKSRLKTSFHIMTRLPPASLSINLVKRLPQHLKQCHVLDTSLHKVIKEITILKWLSEYQIMKIIYLHLLSLYAITIIKTSYQSRD